MSSLSFLGEYKVLIDREICLQFYSRQNLILLDIYLYKIKGENFCYKYSTISLTSFIIYKII